LSADLIPNIVIRNYGTGGVSRVLDVDAWSTNDRGKVHVWDYRTDGNVTNQRWGFIPTPSSAFFWIGHLNSGKCLNMSIDAGDIDGARVYQFTCDWTTFTRNQLWYFHRIGVGGDPVIRSAEDGRCLDIRAFDQSNGAEVQVWSCNTQDRAQWNQTWFIMLSIP